MTEAADLIVVGGGPAGTAAGIAALRQGLSVVLLEVAARPRERPGETMHPGLEPIFRELGVFEAVVALSQLRPRAQRIAWGNCSERLDIYGTDARGPWCGFQVNRAALDEVLLARFRALGGRLIRPSQGAAPLIERDAVIGVSASGRAMRASFVIDATGSRGWLRRALGLAVIRVSPPLLAHHGYIRGRSCEHPTICGDRDKWRWTAEVAPSLVGWVEVSLNPPAGGLHDDRVTTDENVANVGATDVTWRMAECLAGPGWLLVGDAACSLDPLGGHGVLRALMSGMMAAHSAAQRIAGVLDQDRVERSYGAWLQSWFQADAGRLLALYRELGIDWTQRIGAVPHSSRRA